MASINTKSPDSRRFISNKYRFRTSFAAQRESERNEIRLSPCIKSENFFRFIRLFSLVGSAAYIRL